MRHAVRPILGALLAGGIALVAATSACDQRQRDAQGHHRDLGGVRHPHGRHQRIVAKGAFSGVGRIVEVPNLPGDPDSVSRDDLVFAEGSMHLVSTNLDFQISVNPHSCVANVTIPQTGEIVGGTGQFTAATGSFTSTVTASAILARDPDRSCSQERDPLHEVDQITSTGMLAF